MFYTLQMRDRTGVLHYESSHVSGWTVSQDRALTYGSESAARSRALFISRTESEPVLVVRHLGAWIATAAKEPVAAYLSGKVTNANA